MEELSGKSQSSKWWNLAGLSTPADSPGPVTLVTVPVRLVVPGTCTSNLPPLCSGSGNRRRTSDVAEGSYFSV